MINNPEPVENFQQLYEDVKKYVFLQMEYVKVEFVEKLTILLSTLLILTLITVLAIIALFYLFFSLAYAIEPVVGSLSISFGIIAGIWADKFDQMAAFQNFVIMPLTFLSGVFYSIHSLPPIWQTISKFNPFFYMIDGFRYGFFGQADISPWISLVVVVAFLLALAWLCLKMLKSGYKLRG